MKTYNCGGGKIYSFPMTDMEHIKYFFGANNGRETVQEAYKRLTVEYGREPDLLFNCELFESDTRYAASDVVSGGSVHRLREGYGIAFPENKTAVFCYKNNVGAKDYIGAYPVLIRGGKLETSIPVGLSGSRGRTAMGIGSNNLMVALIPDGNNDVTLSTLRNHMKAAGCVDAINLDGGGSTQFYAPGFKFFSNREVRGFVGIWFKKPNTTPIDTTKTETVVSKPIEQSKTEATKFVEPVKKPTDIREEIMNIVQDLIPKGRINRPGTINSMKYITIHETNNASKGSNAKSHASYIKTIKDQTSWHYTVDDKSIYQHIPDNEKSYHTSDKFANENSIAIEICVNSDGDFSKAVANSIELVRELMAKYKIPIENVKTHKDWTGKKCPAILLSGWDKFIEECVKTDEPDVIYKVQVGAFSVKANAEALADKLNELGYPTYIVKVEK